MFLEFLSANTDKSECSYITNTAASGLRQLYIRTYYGASLPGYCEFSPPPPSPLHLLNDATVSLLLAGSVVGK